MQISGYKKKEKSISHGFICVYLCGEHERNGKM